MADYLEIWAGGRQELVPLEDERVTVGRTDGNDVVIADERVSRLHAAFERVAGEWLVRDLGSRNGTFLNGAPVDGRERLAQGDVLRIGDTELRVAS